MVRLSGGFPVEPLKVKFVPLRPMRSTFPSSRHRSGSPSSYSANLMLDEPPLIVRMDCIVSDFSSGSVILEVFTVAAVAFADGPIVLNQFDRHINQFHLAG